MTLEEMKQQWPEVKIGHSIDYTNKQFGKLTCLYRTISNSSGTVWVCQCECGNIKPMSIQKIKNRKNPTCGCGTSKDITGQRFGSLIALKKVPSKNGKTYWLCQCDCGNQKEIQTTHLLEGSTQSCGCQLHKNNLPLLNQERICEICGKHFFPINNGWSRKFCYECAPKIDENMTYAQQISIKRRAIKKALVNYKGGKCEKCGYNKSMRALEFHHLNPQEKDFGISKNINKSIDKLKQEVDKCILVCSNCHAEIHDELYLQGYDI